MFKHEKQLFHPVGVEAPNPQYAALLQELIHQGSLPMVDVGNDGDISQVVSYIHI